MISVLPTPKKEAREEIVDALCKLLVEAQKGNIVGLAVAAITAENRCQTICPPSTEGLRLVGAVTLLLNGIVNNYPISCGCLDEKEPA